MCIWGSYAYPVQILEVPEDDPITAYKYLCWDNGSEWRSPLQNTYWKDHEVSAPVSRVNVNAGIFSFKDFPGLQSYRSLVYPHEFYVELEIWGKMREFARQSGYAPGYISQHARVVAWRESGRWQHDAANG